MFYSLTICHDENRTFKGIMEPIDIMYIANSAEEAIEDEFKDEADRNIPKDSDLARTTVAKRSFVLGDRSIAIISSVPLLNSCWMNRSTRL